MVLERRLRAVLNHFRSSCNIVKMDVCRANVDLTIIPRDPTLVLCPQAVSVNKPFTNSLSHCSDWMAGG
jgi:hypothetical protein